MKICLPLVFIILIVMFPGSAFSETNNPITIGYSNRHDATNANNGRRVVRSVEGDLFVVYMDSLNGSSVIWGTMSTNGGEDWSKPALIDTGDYCSCAIAQDSSIDKTYLCYTASGGQEIRVKYPFSEIGPELPFQEIRRGGATTCQYPAIEATSRWVHVVWQETNLYTQTSNIYYQRFSLDLHLKSHIAVLSSDSCNSRLPVIAADLEYQPGLVHIMWTDYPISGAHSRITYMNITEKDEIKRCAPQVLPESHGCEHPSISTRNNYYGPYEIASYLVVAHSDPVNKRVCFAWVYADTSGIRTSTNDHLNTATAPFVSVDDILPSEPSCAIVWQDDRDIYYSQTLGTRLIVYPPVMISEPNYVHKRNPNVCYKTYNGEVFDVIWTEGNAPPYAITFLRMNKMFPGFEIATDKLPPGTYRKSYQSRIRACGYYQNYFRWKIIAGQLPPGLSLYSHNQDALIEGIPTVSGSHAFTVTLGSMLNEIREDTASFTITIANTAPEIVSPDSVQRDERDRIVYHAHAIDPEDNPVYYEFQGYPSWLVPLDSTMIGDIPANAADSSFVLIATDKDMADTLSVKIIVNVSGVDDAHTMAPENYSLYQNYPNPFNAETMVAFRIPKASHLKMKIYNIYGQEMKTLIDRRMESGSYRVSWDGADRFGNAVASGIYIVRLVVDHYSSSIKTVVIR